MKIPKITPLTFLLTVTVLSLGIAILIQHQTPRHTPQPAQQTAPAVNPNSAIGIAIDAANKENSSTRIRKEAENLGFDCYWLTASECIRFIDRVRSHQKLLNAIEVAKANNVTVLLWDKFYISNKRIIFVATDATDQQIIDFLLGKPGSSLRQ